MLWCLGAVVVLCFVAMVLCFSSLVLWCFAAMVLGVVL